MEVDEENIEHMSLVEGTDKMVEIGKVLDPKFRLNLKDSAYLFTHSAADVPCIDPTKLLIS